MRSQIPRYRIKRQAIEKIIPHLNLPSEDEARLRKIPAVRWIEAANRGIGLVVAPEEGTAISDLSVIAYWLLKQDEQVLKSLVPEKKPRFEKRLFTWVRVLNLQHTEESEYLGVSSATTFMELGPWNTTKSFRLSNPRIVGFIQYKTKEEMLKAHPELARRYGEASQ